MHRVSSSIERSTSTVQRAVGGSVSGGLYARITFGGFSEYIVAVCSTRGNLRDFCWRNLHRRLFHHMNSEPKIVPLNESVCTGNGTTGFPTFRHLSHQQDDVAAGWPAGRGALKTHINHVSISSSA